MSDHLIAEANRHAMALPTTHPTHADIAWYVRELSELAAERDQLRAELATERARLDYLLRWDVTFHDRAAIDRDMQEVAK